MGTGIHHSILPRSTTAVVVMLCVGCGTTGMILPPQPMLPPQPISQPQPVWQPQPITQQPPILQPLPIVQPISQPQPISLPNSGILALSGSTAQQSTVQAALARCTFPFDRLKPGLQRAGIPQVRISWQPMDDGGLGWASTDGQVAIKDSISGLQAQRTAILELGHIVDFFYMTPDMRKAVIKLWNPDLPDNHEWFGDTAYWDQMGEAYSVLFLWAFTDEEMWFDAGYAHKPSKELAAQLRAILLPKVAMR